MRLVTQPRGDKQQGLLVAEMPKEKKGVFFPYG